MTDSPRPLFGPPPRARTSDMYRPAPIVRSRAEWIDALRAKPPVADLRPRGATEPAPIVRHAVDWAEVFAPTRRRRIR